MDLPDTSDSELALWRKLLTNLGGTDAPSADKRETLVQILTALTS